MWKCRDMLVWKWIVGVAWWRKYFVSHHYTEFSLFNFFRYAHTVHVREYSVMPVEENDYTLLQNGDKNRLFLHFHRVKISLVWMSFKICLENHGVRTASHRHFMLTFIQFSQIMLNACVGLTTLIVAPKFDYFVSDDQRPLLFTFCSVGGVLLLVLTSPIIKHSWQAE